MPPTIDPPIGETHLRLLRLLDAQPALSQRGIKSKAVVTAHFLQRKMTEYAALNAEIDALKREVAQNDTANVVSNPTNAATNAATTLATNSLSSQGSRK